MGFQAPKGYGLWVIDQKTLQTNLGVMKTYGILEVMGFQRYGLWEILL
jgi:hypothetical protein